MKSLIACLVVLLCLCNVCAAEDSLATLVTQLQEASVTYFAAKDVRDAAKVELDAKQAAYDSASAEATSAWTAFYSAYQALGEALNSGRTSVLRPRLPVRR